ncbi:MAG: DUF1905 domain-containing protein [Alphaproteobacteria bacterium]
MVLAKNNFYQFNAVVKKSYHGRGLYHYIHVPKPLSKKLHFWYEGKQRGFQSLQVKALIGDSSWLSSIFLDFADNKIYLLLLNKKMMAKNAITAGKKIKVGLTILSARK